MPQQLLKLGGGVERIWLTSRHRTVLPGQRLYNINESRGSRAVKVGNDEIRLFEQEGAFTVHEARHLPMGPWSLGDGADVAPLLYGCRY